MTRKELIARLESHAKWVNSNGDEGSRANFVGASLAETDFKLANLQIADFREAYLQGADFEHANLQGASFRNAVLRGANLHGANLMDSDLRGADVKGANFDGAEGVIDVGTPHGFRTIGWIFHGTLMLRAGCHNFTIDQARAYWADKPGREEARAALDYIETVARVRGWGETK